MLLFGDNPALSQVLDVMNTLTGTPVTHCLFRNKTCEEGSKFAYTSKSNYRSTSLLRAENRTLELHLVVMKKEDTDNLRIKPGAVDAIPESGGRSFIKLCNELKEVIYVIPKRRDGDRVLEAFQNPFMHNAIDKSTLLIGISKFFKEFCSVLVEEHWKARSSDLELHVHMREIGIGSQKVWFNQKKKALKGISISATF